MSKDSAIDAFYTQLGSAIQEARKNRNVKQQDLANHLRLSRASIVNIEKGRQRIQLHTLTELANYLDLSAGELLDNYSNPNIERKINKEIKSENLNTIQHIKEFYSKTLSRNRK